MDIGNDQSIAIYFDRMGEQPCLQFKQGRNGIPQETKILNLDYKNSKAFVQAIPDLNRVFAKILAGEWDMQERKELTENLVTKVSAKILPQIKIIKKASVAKWFRFDIKFLEWARLYNAATDILIKLFNELEDYSYEKPMSVSIAGYRWRMIKENRKGNPAPTEAFTGPWQKNLYTVVNNCKEFRKRMQQEDIEDGRDTVVIDMLDVEGKVKALGPICD